MNQPFQVTLDGNTLTVNGSIETKGGFELSVATGFAVVVIHDRKLVIRVVVNSHKQETIVNLSGTVEINAEKLFTGDFEVFIEPLGIHNPTRNFIGKFTVS